MEQLEDGNQRENSIKDSENTKKGSWPKRKKKLKHKMKLLKGQNAGQERVRKKREGDQMSEPEREEIMVKMAKNTKSRRSRAEREMRIGKDTGRTLPVLLLVP